MLVTIPVTIEYFTMLDAICCAVKLSAELKDRILQLNADYLNDIETHLVFIDDLSRVYTDPNEVEESEDSPMAPFAGQSPYDCYKLLRRLCEDNGSDIDCDSFAIIDERSLTDDTMLLVTEPEESDGGESMSVRIAFEMLQSQLFLRMAGSTTVEEDRERAARSDDGVRRPGMDID
ncbi:hypothetical protein KCU95_g6601, partial [Aureobasidium melanogenum]